jgi:ABC-2 type transport system permease protein
VRGALLAVAELRARLLWRRLTARGGLGEGVARVALLLLALPLGLAFAAALGVGTWQAVRTGRGLQVEVAAAAIFFGLWQTWTAVSLTVNDRDGLDLRRFLAYPLPPGRIYALGLASGVAGDPIAAFWGLLLGGVFVGAAVARPGPWLAGLALALLLFAVATVLYVALLQEALSVVLATRWAREWATVLSVLLAVGVVVAAVGGAPRTWRELGALVPALRAAQWLAWPAAFSAAAARRLFAGDASGAWPWLLGQAAASALAGRTAYAVALRQALSGGGAGAPGEGARGTGWRIPGTPAFAGLLEKEGKALLRHPLTRMAAVVVPLVSGLVAWKVAPLVPAAAGEVVRALPLFGVAAYSHVFVQAFWLNALGWDRGGARLAFLAPVDPAGVLAAKNVAVYVVALGVFALGAVPVLAAGAFPPAWAVAGALALHAGMAPWLYAAGNAVSVLNPKAASFAVQRHSSLPALSGLAGLAVVSLVSGIFALPVLLALRLEAGWILPAAWTGLGVAGLALLRRALRAEGRLLAARRDELLPVVCGDEA